MKITLGVGKVNGNDAVFLLADSTTVLSLHAESFDSFFDETGFVDDADGMFASMFFGNDFLNLVPHLLVIPLLFGEEPLNGSDGNVCLEGDGFAIFPGQVGGETVGVKAEIVPGVFSGTQDSNRRSRVLKSVRILSTESLSMPMAFLNLNALKNTVYRLSGKKEEGISLRCSISRAIQFRFFQPR
jgi:hypothetical protein